MEFKNNITVIPPDLYTYFEANPEEFLINSITTVWEKRIYAWKNYLKKYLENLV